MPNGFHGSKDDWERLVEPLRELDGELNAFAREHGMRIDENYHNMANRMLRWSMNSIDRVIQISLYGDDLVLLAYHAFRDEAGKRYIKFWDGIKDVSIAQFQIMMPQLLESAYRELQQVQASDLAEVKHK